jgi:hypothetical protein
MRQGTFMCVFDGAGKYLGMVFGFLLMVGGFAWGGRGISRFLNPDLVKIEGDLAAKWPFATCEAVLGFACLIGGFLIFKEARKKE